MTERENEAYNEGVKEGWKKGYAAGFVAGDKHAQQHFAAAVDHIADTMALNKAIDARINALLKEHGVQQELTDHELFDTGIDTSEDNPDYSPAEAKKAFAEFLRRRDSK